MVYYMHNQDSLIELNAKRNYLNLGTILSLMAIIAPALFFTTESCEPDKYSVEEDFSEFTKNIVNRQYLMISIVFLALTICLLAVSVVFLLITYRDHKSFFNEYWKFLLFAVFLLTIPPMIRCSLDFASNF